MNRTEIVKQLDETLAEWERDHKWGELQIEIKDGVPVLMRATVQQKLNHFQYGGFPNGHKIERR